MAQIVSILHIDRNQLFRTGLRHILSNSEFVVEAEVSTLTDGLSELQRVHPELVLVDTNTANLVLIDLMEGVRAEVNPARVVVLTDHVGLELLTDALHAGVDGYLLKDMSSEALKQSLALVMIGEKVFPTELAQLLVNLRFMPRGDGATGTVKAATLSGRELEILGCLVNGLSNKVIASQLNITEGTVKVHLKGILKKIKVVNRTQAAIWALNQGMMKEVAPPAEPYT